MKELLIALLALGTITAFSSDTMSCSGECIYTYPSKKLLTMELEGNPKLKTT